MADQTEMTDQTMHDEKSELQLALQTCKLIRGSLQATLDCFESAVRLEAVGMFALPVVPMMWKLHRARRHGARAQKLEQLLVPQIERLAELRGLSLPTRSGGALWGRIGRDVGEAAELVRGELAYHRRVATALRERLRQV